MSLLFFALIESRHPILRARRSRFCAKLRYVGVFYWGGGRSSCCVIYIYSVRSTFKKFDFCIDFYNSSLCNADMETVQSIYARLKSADNKILWAFAQELYAANKKLDKVKEKTKPVKESIIDLKDKEGLRTTVLEHLFAESAKGNAQASDKLARIAGLGEDKQDIIIEVVNYKPQKAKKSKPMK